MPEPLEPSDTICRPSRADNGSDTVKGLDLHGPGHRASTANWSVLRRLCKLVGSVKPGMKIEVGDSGSILGVGGVNRTQGSDLVDGSEARERVYDEGVNPTVLKLLPSVGSNKRPISLTVLSMSKSEDDDKHHDPKDTDTSGCSGEDSEESPGSDTKRPRLYPMVGTGGGGERSPNCVSGDYPILAFPPCGDEKPRQARTCEDFGKTDVGSWPTAPFISSPPELPVGPEKRPVTPEPPVMNFVNRPALPQEGVELGNVEVRAGGQVTTETSMVEVGGWEETFKSHLACADTLNLSGTESKTKPVERVVSVETSMIPKGPAQEGILTVHMGSGEENECPATAAAWRSGSYAPANAKISELTKREQEGDLLFRRLAQVKVLLDRVDSALEPHQRRSQRKPHPSVKQGTVVRRISRTPMALSAAENVDFAAASLGSNSLPGGGGKQRLLIKIPRSAVTAAAAAGAGGVGGDGDRSECQDGKGVCDGEGGGDEGHTGHGGARGSRRGRKKGKGKGKGGTKRGRPLATPKAQGQASPVPPPSVAGAEAPVDQTGGPPCPGLSDFFGHVLDLAELEGAVEGIQFQRASQASKGLSALSGVTPRQLGGHLQSLRLDYLVQRMRPILAKLMHTSTGPKQHNVFNQPVNPIRENIPDYFERVPNPMDLGTVKARLLSMYYTTPEAFAVDVRLVFTNAIGFNPEHHFVHVAAMHLLQEFDTDFCKLVENLGKSWAKSQNHTCQLCQGQTCTLCGEKCLKMEPPVIFCQHCNKRVVKNGTYYVTHDGLRIWCSKCYTSLPSELPAEGDRPRPPSRATGESETEAEGGVEVQANTVLTEAAQVSTAVASRELGEVEPTPVPNIGVTVASGPGELMGASGECHVGSDSVCVSQGGPSDEHALGTVPGVVPPGSLENGEHQSGTSEGGGERKVVKATAGGCGAGLDTGDDRLGGGGGEVVDEAVAVVTEAAVAGKGEGGNTQWKKSKKHQKDKGQGPFKRDLLRRKYEDDISEPWVQCDRCNSWVHQVCALFNARANAGYARFMCPLCRLMDVSNRMVEEQVAKNPDDPRKKVKAGIGASPGMVGGPGGDQRTCGGGCASGSVSCDCIGDVNSGCGHGGCHNINGVTAGKGEGSREGPDLPTPVQVGDIGSTVEEGGEGGSGCDFSAVDGGAGGATAHAGFARGGGAVEANHLMEGKGQGDLARKEYSVNSQGGTDSAGAVVVATGLGTGDQGGMETVTMSVESKSGADKEALEAPVEVALPAPEGRGVSIAAVGGAGSGGMGDLGLERPAPVCQGDTKAEDGGVGRVPRVGVGEEGALARQGVENGEVSSASFNTASDRDAHVSALGPTTSQVASPDSGNAGGGMAAAAGGDDSFQDVYMASKLPHTPMSRYIESRVQRRLSTLGCEEGVAQSVSIRLVSNVEAVCEVSPVLREIFCCAAGKGVGLNKSDVPEAVRYRSKVLCMFQQFDGVDVCLFAMYAQEYNKDAPYFNARRAYISYLDSVDYFRPRHHRTAVYHEILVSYLDWLRRRGFVAAHIWSCPPQRGNNFIFWCHPPHQKTPTRDRLANWYNAMLKRASLLGLVSKLSTLNQTHFGEVEQIATLLKIRRTHAAAAAAASAAGVKDPEDIPLRPEVPVIFDGDFWVEEAIRLARQVERKEDSSSDETMSALHHCRQALEELLRHSNSAPFATPVDPERDRCPDYLQVIENPMDLGTIADRMDRMWYHNAAGFVADVRLTFENAQRYNPAKHPISMTAKKLLRLFEKNVKSLENMVTHMPGMHDTGLEMLVLEEEINTTGTAEGSGTTPTVSGKSQGLPSEMSIGPLGKLAREVSATAAREAERHAFQCRQAEVDVAEGGREEEHGDPAALAVSQPSSLTPPLLSLRSNQSSDTMGGGGDEGMVDEDDVLGDGRLSRTASIASGCAAEFYGPVRARALKRYESTSSLSGFGLGGSGAELCPTSVQQSSLPFVKEVNTESEEGDATSSRAGRTSPLRSPCVPDEMLDVEVNSAPGEDRITAALETGEGGAGGEMSPVEQSEQQSSLAPHMVVGREMGDPGGDDEKRFSTTRIGSMGCLEELPSKVMLSGVTKPQGMLPCAGGVVKGVRGGESGTEAVGRGGGFKGPRSSRLRAQCLDSLGFKAKTKKIKSKKVKPRRGGKGVGGAVLGKADRIGRMLQSLSQSVIRMKNDLHVIALSSPDAPDWQAAAAAALTAATSPAPRDGMRVAESCAAAALEMERWHSVDGLDGLEFVSPDCEDPDPLISRALVDTRHTFLEMCQYRHYQFDTLRRAKHSSAMFLYHLHCPENHGLNPFCSRCQRLIQSVRYNCSLCNYDLCLECNRKMGTKCEDGHDLVPYRVTFVTPNAAEEGRAVEQDIHREDGPIPQPPNNDMEVAGAAIASPAPAFPPDAAVPCTQQTAGEGEGTCEEQGKQGELCQVEAMDVQVEGEGQGDCELNSGDDTSMNVYALASRVGGERGGVGEGDGRSGLDVPGSVPGNDSSMECL